MTNRKFGNGFIPGNLKRYRVPRVPAIPPIHMNFVRQEPGFLQKLKKADKLISWIIVALVISIPITFFTHVIVYIIYPDFIVYRLDFEEELVWFVLLYITCFAGCFLARLGVVCYRFLEDQSYF